MTSPDGLVKYVHVILQGMEGEAGELEYIGAVHDGTSRRSWEEASGQAGSALTHMAFLTTLGILAPSIAHEVTQPLAGIMTNANTCLLALATDPPSLDAARAAARRSLRDVERAYGLTTRLRTLVSKKEVAFELLDLNDAIQATVDLYSSELQKRRVNLRIEFAADLPQVKGDRIQLQQVVLNLLANASEAMSDVGNRSKQILVRTERYDGAQVRVTVGDAGIGLHPRDAEKLFDPSYTTESNGLGIGLYISRSIVERHRGRLWAELHEGHGAAFSFAIPHAV
jgi:C4-dicarboxylate-specific signal transduction histidine kinase